MKRNELLLLILFSIVMQSCIGGCGNINTNKYSEDDNYWDSINKEKRLKEIGMDDAANIERKARQKYMQGGAYTSPNGGSQIYYYGSIEQERDLELIDEYMKSNPNF